MEDTQSSVAKCNSWPTQGGDIDALDTKFIKFCKDGFSLDENTNTQAMNVFKETKHLISTNMSAIGSGTPEEIELFWFAFVLYSVTRLSEKDGGTVQKESRDNPLTLCQILRISKLNLVDFFKDLPQCILKAGPILGNLYGAGWENRLQAKEMQANFVLLSHLSKYYKRAYLEFFMTSVTNSEKQSVVGTATGFPSEHYRFGWLLFLALRVHVFSHFTDLVTCTNGLVSILAILIIHVPVCFRNFNFHDSPHFVKKNDKSVDLIASLCNIYHTSDVELRNTMEKANNLIESVLKKKPCLASECKTKNLENIDTDNLSYFEDLLEETSLSSTLNTLENDYIDAIKNSCEVDERVFVNEDDSLLGSGSFSGGAWNMSGSKRKFDSIASPTKNCTSPLSPSSPANSTMDSTSIVATPVSTAMTTAKWLHTVISPLPSKPSAELEQFLASCDKNVSNDVIRRAHIIMNSIFPSSALEESYASGSLRNAKLENIWAEQRKLEALKLYYRVLEAMCRAETQVLREKNLTSLLTNERFHRCMLACSAELVLATYKTVTMLFPAVLEKTGITAFDLSKVIESFIRHEDSLPRELKRHLNSLEELLLESMVWQKGSSMYNSLVVARPALSAEINRLGLLAEPMPSLDAISAQINFSYGGLPPVSCLQKHEASRGEKGDIRSPKRVCTDYRSALVERNVLISPVKNRLMTSGNLKAKLSPAPLQSAFASPAQPNPRAKGETCADTGIKIFFRKIIKLAAVRVNGMVDRLKQSQKIREDVYWLFQQVLSHHTSLFFNRHIDQIILCCFYGVIKVYKLNLTFKEIVFNYRKQPHCKSQVFQSVFVDSSSACQNVRTGHHVIITTFYNRIFLPTVKPLLEELREPSEVPEVNKNMDGTLAQCPASPKISSFPNLPDMSPRKVSSVHNVYVSPLRSTKKDVLVSHSAKSYYACLGESTRPYQSPSKDLTVINNRLNSDRKLRGALNFSEAKVGLISDSVVAESLCIKYGKWASSKSEQPEA